MARCESCGLFASVELEEPDEPDLDITPDGDGGADLSGTVPLALITECCGDAAGDAEPQVDMTVEIEHTAECTNKEALSVDSVSCETTDRYQDKDRHGKPIKSFRYMRHFYGADVTATIKCDTCDATGEATGLAEEQASSFEV